MKKILSVFLLSVLLISCSAESKKEACELKVVDHQSALLKDITPIQEKINKLNDKITSGSYDMGVVNDISELNKKLVKIQNKYEEKKASLIEECGDVLELE